MNGHIRVIGAGGDGKRMPLLLADGWDVDEKPLARLVLERRLAELDFQCVVRVADDLDDLGCATNTHFSVDTFDHIESTGEQFPSP